jgi:hypothetical protein
MFQDKDNKKLDKQSTEDVLKRLGESLTENEATQIIELAEDRAKVGTQVEEFLEGLRPKIVD